MAANVYYSVCPFGTGDIKTGSPTISISSGVATLSVAQTGNIGQGCRITYNGTSVCYISLVNSPTSFNVVTATGGTPGNVSGQEVNSIAHEYASLSAAEAGMVDANHINNASLVAADVLINLACYYDHDDQTPDSTAFSFLGATMDATRYVRVYAPAGGTQSINRNRHSGVWSDTRQRFVSSAAGTSYVTVRDAKVVIEGMQFKTTASYSSNNYVGIIYNYPTSSGTVLISDCIFIGSDVPNVKALENRGSRADAVASNSIISGFGPSDTTDENTCGVYQRGSTLSVYNCTITHGRKGLYQTTGTLTITNCAVFDNADDFSGTMTVTYTASDDNDIAGTGNVDISPGATEATDWAAAFTDYTNGDFSLKSGSPLIDAGIGPVLDSNVPTTDIVGTSRSGNTCDIGAFEYVAAGGLSIPVAMHHYNLLRSA